MLAECKSHGAYRGETCPECGEKGRFLMNEHELNRVGRIMAGILRHFPERFDLTMDSRGWVDIRQMTGAISKSKERLHWLRSYHIEAIVFTDPKGRYEIDGGMVRATYAHSVEVELDDLPLSNTEELFFPVAQEELDLVLENGLHPTDRKKIHLSGSLDKAYGAGKIRTSEPIILRIDAAKAREDGIEIRRAAKTVYVADEVPAKYLSVVDDVESKIDVAAVTSGED